MVAESQSVFGSLPQEVKYTICTGQYNRVQYKSASEVVVVVSGGCSGGGFGGYCDVVVVVLVYWCTVGGLAALHRHRMVGCWAQKEVKWQLPKKSDWTERDLTKHN